MFYRCPECGSDKDLTVSTQVTISYSLSSNGHVESTDDSIIGLGGGFNGIDNIRCTNCGKEGPAEEFQLRSLTLKPSPESTDEDVITLTAVRTDHLETCPECHTDIDLICIGTNQSDEFRPIVMWCSCGTVWSNVGSG